MLWSRMTPYTNDTAANILLKNRIASNPGNLLFTYSVARTAMTGDVELIPFFSEDVDRMLRNVSTLNETYDCAVIPLANAFRTDYIPKLENLTRFIRSVNFPCYVIGVGIQARDMEEVHRGFVFDKAVKDFVSAVLEKSAKLGLRGEITAEYLRALGFIPEQHFTVIGCPAAYITGSQCREIVPKPFEDIRCVSVNAKPGIPKQTHNLIARSIPRFEKANFVTQDIYELWAIYFGLRYTSRKRVVPEYYPSVDKEGHSNWKNGRVTGFLRASDWMQYMQGIDLSFGSRIHGNLAAVVSGTPALVFMSDLRVLELANYHGLPGIMSKDITPETDIRELYEKADHAAFARNYSANFSRYVSFLNELGIKHIYDKNEPEFGQAPCDLAIVQANALPDIYQGMPISFTNHLRKVEMYRMMFKYKLDRRMLQKKLQQK